jgi:hypothetical protein
VQIKLIKEVQPDLVVLTGDMFTGNTDSCHGVNAVKDCFEEVIDGVIIGLQSLDFPHGINELEICHCLGKS